MAPWTASVQPVGPPGDTPSAPCGTWPPSSAPVLTPVDPNDLELGMGNQLGGFTTQQMGWTKEYYGIFTYRFLTTNYMIQHDFTVEPFNHETLGFHGILIAIYMYICYPTIFNFVLSQNRVVTPKCHGSSALCLFNWSFGTAWDTVHQ